MGEGAADPVLIMMPRAERKSRGHVAQPRIGSTRCAIYTRKSSDEGLEQEFNSLDAQREACEAYIVSQRHEGWVTLPEMYDDGGLSGGTMERPALRRLLDDIRSGKVDIVVVYKVDRLTRSLADFAKIVDILDAAGASFVSVTQQFNTTSSMGRLTLNMLLSFAQFEREIAGERIRDKIAASKARGMWMGGNVPLGYDAIDRKLVVNEEEAEKARLIFERYAVLGSVRLLREELDRLGVTSKHRPAASGTLAGGRPFSRGALYTLLQNPIYVGRIAHQGQTYEGQHSAIIDDDLWQRVQTRLAAHRRDRKLGRAAKAPSLLAGLVHDAEGNVMTPSHANKNGRRYRYYVSTKLNDGKATGKRDQRPSADYHPAKAPVQRIAAHELDAVIIDRLQALLQSRSDLLDAFAPLNLDAGAIAMVLKAAADLAERWPTMSSLDQRAIVLAIVKRIELNDNEIAITLDRSALAKHLGAKIEDEELIASPPLVLTARIQLHRSRRGQRLIIEGSQPAADAGLVDLLSQAFAVRDDVHSGQFDSIEALSRNHAIPKGRATSLLRLSWLAPHIVTTIVDGHQPPDLTPKKLLAASKDLPIDWSAQANHLGFSGA